MPLFDGVKCELCPQEKKDTNHWYILLFTFLNQPGLTVYSFDLEFAKALRDQKQKFHILCGPACVVSDINSSLENLYGTHDSGTSGRDPEPG